MRSYYVSKLKMDLFHCDTRQEICDLVASHISKYGGDVVTDDEGAERYFESLNMTGEVRHNEIVNQTISVCEKDEERYDVWVGIKVVVTEHYIDSGSDDYVYSYDID